MESIDEYVKGHALQRYAVQTVIQEFDKEISQMHGRCIDIGSGPGDVTKELLMPYLSPYTQIVGADISQSMTDYARVKYANDTRLSFITLDIEAAELPQNEIGRYDSAVSFFCLHWCRNIRRAFENIYKLLRPGGTSFVEFLGHHVGFEVYNTLKNNSRYEPYMQDASRFIPYFQRYAEPEDSKAHLRQILQEIGFKILHCSNREIHYVYKNQETFKKHLVAVNPFISRMPENIKDEFSDDLTNEIMSRILRQRDGQGGEKEEQQEMGTVPDKYNILLAYVQKPHSTS